MGIRDRCRRGHGEGHAELLYRDFDESRADERRVALVKSLTESDGGYEGLFPLVEIGLPFRPRVLEAAYLSWPLLTKLMPVSFPGVQTKRDELVVDVDEHALRDRMTSYFDFSVTHQDMARICPRAMTETARFSAAETRDYLRARGVREEWFRRYLFRPFDARWVYWEPETRLLGEKSPSYPPHVSPTNLWLSAGQRSRKGEFYQPQVTRVLADHHLVESNVQMVPLFLSPDAHKATLFDPDSASRPRANVSAAAIAYLDGFDGSPDELFYTVVGLLNSPAYARENAGALRQDWPRIPLPATRDALLASAELGRRVATLLDVEEPVDAVTTGSVRHELRPLGVLTSATGGQLDPSAGDLAVAAGWGHAGQGGELVVGEAEIGEALAEGGELGVGVGALEGAAAARHGDTALTRMSPPGGDGKVSCGGIELAACCRGEHAERAQLVAHGAGGDCVDRLLDIEQRRDPAAELGGGEEGVAGSRERDAGPVLAEGAGVLASIRRGVEQSDDRVEQLIR